MSEQYIDPKVYSWERAKEPYSKLDESSSPYETAFEIHVYQVNTCKSKIKNHSLDEKHAHSAVRVTKVTTQFVNKYAV